MFKYVEQMSPEVFKMTSFLLNWIFLIGFRTLKKEKNTKMKGNTYEWHAWMTNKKTQLYQRLFKLLVLKNYCCKHKMHPIHLYNKDFKQTVSFFLCFLKKKVVKILCTNIFIYFCFQGHIRKNVMYKNRGAFSTLLWHNIYCCKNFIKSRSYHSRSWEHKYYMVGHNWSKEKTKILVK